MNFAKGAPGEPSLLSIDDARTLFHEFGHGLHGLLSNVTYPAVSGTSVEKDFVELPSQLYEHWMMHPQVLKKFGRHYKTGKPVPEALLKKIKAARNFNQGFATVEYRGGGDRRSRPARAGGPERSRCGCVREGDAGQDRRAGRDRHAPSHPALPAHHRRLCVRLLQLHVVGGDGCRRVRRVRGEGRHLRSGHGEASSTTTSIPPAASATRPTPTRRSAAGCRRRRRCSRSGGWRQAHGAEWRRLPCWLQRPHAIQADEKSFVRGSSHDRAESPPGSNAGARAGRQPVAAGALLLGPGARRRHPADQVRAGVLSPRHACPDDDARPRRSWAS